MVGKSIPRVDAYEKVTGRAMFTDDLAPAGCLIAKRCIMRALETALSNPLIPVRRSPWKAW